MNNKVLRIIVIVFAVANLVGYLLLNSSVPDGLKDFIGYDMFKNFSDYKDYYGAKRVFGRVLLVVANLLSIVAFVLCLIPSKRAMVPEAPMAHGSFPPPPPGIDR